MAIRIAHLLVYIELPEDLRSIKQMLVVKDPVLSQWSLPGQSMRYAHFFALNASRGKLSNSASQYPLIKNKKVRNPCTAASGTI